MEANGDADAIAPIIKAKDGIISRYINTTTSAVLFIKVYFPKGINNGMITILTIAITGAIINNFLLALEGIIVFFPKSFIKS